MTLTPLAPADGNLILPLADARAALNIIGVDYDARITRARNGAIDFAERYTGIAFLNRGFRWSIPRFSSRTRLPIGPVTNVSAVNYRNSDGTSTALVAPDWYLANGALTAAFGKSWPYGDNVSIDFTAGHATVAAIPELLMSGMIVAMAAMFADVENPSLDGARRCLDLHRTVVL